VLSDQRKHLFFLVGQTFLLPFRWFYCLSEILLIFGRNKLSPLSSQTSLSGITHSCLWHDRRKEEGSSLSKEFRQICFLPHFCVSAILSKVWISARQFFKAVPFRYFSFLGSGCKSRIVCRLRSRSYSGGDKSLTRLSPTPPTRLTKPKEKYTPACQSKPERRTSYLSFSVFVFYRWLLHARFINIYLHLSDCVACNQIFYFSSESVSFPFTSISMRSSPYRIR